MSSSPNLWIRKRETVVLKLGLGEHIGLHDRVEQALVNVLVSQLGLPPHRRHFKYSSSHLYTVDIFSCKVMRVTALVTKETSY